MTDADALLRAILLNPADDAPRLVYADFLDERGDGPRAEFIRVQVWHGRNPPAHGLRDGCDCPSCKAFRREHALSAGRARDWVGPVWPYVREHNFYRGLPEWAVMDVAEFLGRAAAVFASLPLIGVRLADRDPRLDAGYFGWYFPWDRAPMGEDSSILPPKLFELLDGMLNPDDPAGDEFAYYETALEADAALSRACVSFGRAEAGLAPLRRRVSRR
jgi:uncharacterized protein (TIGR02996 family)